MWGRQEVTGAARINSVLGSFNKMIEDLGTGLDELNAENNDKRGAIAELEQGIKTNLEVMATAFKAKSNIEALVA